MKFKHVSAYQYTQLFQGYNAILCDSEHNYIKHYKSWYRWGLMHHYSNIFNNRCYVEKIIIYAPSFLKTNWCNVFFMLEDGNMLHFKYSDLDLAQKQFKRLFGAIDIEVRV